MDAVLPVMGETRLAGSSGAPTPGSRLHHLLIGGSGIVGTVLSRALMHEGHAVSVMDPETPRDHVENWLKGTAQDRQSVCDLVSQADVVVYLATGASGGWDALVDTEIRGLVNVLDACVQHPTLTRLVLASSNHVVGGFELDKPTYGVTAPYEPDAPVRPDGLYGAAKCFAEGACRSASELFALPVSVLRIGTMRMIDDPSAHLDDPGFARYGGREEVRRRLARSWLSHQDCWRIYQEEVDAEETFRLRFATSAPDTIWSGAIETWDAPGRRETGDSSD